MPWAYVKPSVTSHVEQSATQIKCDLTRSRVYFHVGYICHFRGTVRGNGSVPRQSGYRRQVVGCCQITGYGSVVPGVGAELVAGDLNVLLPHGGRQPGLESLYFPEHTALLRYHLPTHWYIHQLRATSIPSLYF